MSGRGGDEVMSTQMSDERVEAALIKGEEHVNTLPHKDGRLPCEWGLTTTEVALARALWGHRRNGAIGPLRYGPLIGYVEKLEAQCLHSVIRGLKS